MGGGPEGFRTVAYFVNWYETTLYRDFELS
jgi:hypothetical protein